MSVIPSKTDITGRDRHVRFVPKSDIGALSPAMQIWD
jgi:hypothetical protein